MKTTEIAYIAGPSQTISSGAHGLVMADNAIPSPISQTPINVPNAPRILEITGCLRA